MQEIQIDGRVYEVECVHTGQYRPYGDTFRVSEIRTTVSDKNQVVDDLSSFLDFSVPDKEHWNTNDIGEYFRGYYTLEKKDYGWIYTKCEPYTD